MVGKISVSLTEELLTVLDDLATQRAQERSPLIETFLREHPLVQNAVARERSASSSPARLTTRDKILHFIERNPGVTKREACQALEMGWGTLGHHLYELTRTGKVAIEIHRRQLHMFSSGVPKSQRPGFVKLNPLAQRILDKLRWGPKTISELSKELDHSRKVIRTQLRILESELAVQASSRYHPEYELRKGKAE